MAYCAVYLNRVYRERNMPEKPEDPLIQEKDIPYDADFTYVDIVPSVLAYSSQEVEYHKFSHLIESANSWLRRNSHWKLINCETVKLIYRHNLTNMVSRWEQQINPATAMWSGSQLRTNEYETSLKVLRLWIRRKDIDDDDLENLMNSSGHFAITLKHIDFVPSRLSGSTFESVDEVLVRLNERINQPDARRWNMISLQSLKVEANSDWNLTDPEVSLAEESSRYIIVLRLFYEEFNYGGENGEKSGDKDTCQNEQSSVKATIGIEDFKPRHLSGGSFFKRPQFEPFSALVQRSGKWLTSQSGVQFLNAQSIDIKVKSLSKVESRASSHIEHGDYIQILRVIFLKLETVSTSAARARPQSAQAILTPNSCMINSRTETSAAASMRLGAKVVLTTKFEHPLDSLQQRIQGWLRANNNSDTNANSDVVVLSAETVDVFGKDDDERNLERALEDCFQPGRMGSLNMYAFTAIRLFYAIVPNKEAEKERDKQEREREKEKDKEKDKEIQGSLSAGASRHPPNNNNNNNNSTNKTNSSNNNTPKQSRGDQLNSNSNNTSSTLTKRQRWSRNASSATETGGTRTSRVLRHQSSTVEAITFSTSPKQQALLSRRPTSQFDAVVISAALAARAADFVDSRFDDGKGGGQMRPRSSSTSCNCM